MMTTSTMSLRSTRVQVAPTRTSQAATLGPRPARHSVRVSASTSPALPSPPAPAPGLSRRAALSSALLAPSLLSALINAPSSSAAGYDVKAVDWAGLRSDIKDLISDPNAIGGIGDKGPTIVRLAWHSSGTYDKMTKTGGSGGGTIRFKEELAHGANAGLNDPVSWLEPLKKKYPAVSYADLYTLAGVVSIESMGGPTIDWRAGRVDEMDPSAVTPDGRLPEPDKGNPMATAKGLRDVFYRMGFNDKEIVALSGAHALGRCHADYTGYIGPWTPTPTVFSNLYFKLLLKTEWTPNTPKNFQYKDPSGTLMMLPSDIVLTQDPEFMKYVQLYSKDKKLFYSDFQKAFSKLLELGTKDLVKV